MSLLETFLGSVESITSDHKGPRTRISELPDGFAYLTPYLLRHTSDSVLTYPPASSHHFIDARDRCARQKTAPACTVEDLDRVHWFARV
jgi:hypothetical protein